MRGSPVVPVHVLIVILTILFLGTPAVRLQAQAPERRPSPVFGAPDPRQSSEESSNGGLSVSGSGFGAYGDDLATDQGFATALRPHPQVPGSTYGFDGRLYYDRMSEQLALYVNAASTGGYYPAVERLALGRQFAGISSSWIVSPWRSARMSTGGSAQYSQNGTPFTEVMAPFENQPGEMIYGDELIGSPHRGSVRGHFQLEQDLGRAKSIGVIAGAQSSLLQGSERLDGYDLGGTFSAGISRYATFRAGYTLHQMDRGVGIYAVHQADIGGDYRRPLSASRRTFVSFRGGSAALESRGRTHFFVTADASLSYELRRSWTGRLRYNRGLMFVEEIIDPLVSDGLSADLNGLLSRRIDLTASGSFRHGNVGLSSNASSYHVYGARTRIRLALSRISAVYAEYLFFHYRFAEYVRLGGGLPSFFDRQTIRVGVTIMTQLLR
jgi:hypothetical protein